MDIQIPLHVLNFVRGYEEVLESRGCLLPANWEIFQQMNPICKLVKIIMLTEHK